MLGSRWRELAVTPLYSDSLGGDSRSVAAMIVTAVCAVLLLASPLAVARVSSSGRTDGVLRVEAPLMRPPWRAVNEDVTDWKPTFLGHAAEVLQKYRSANGDVDVYIGYYLREQQGAELVNSENQLADAKSWTTVREGQRSVVVDGQEVRVRETLLRSPQGVHRLVWSWYWVAGEFTASASYAKLLQAKAQLFGGPIGAAVVAIAAKYDTAPVQATPVLQDFLDRSAPWHTTLSGFVCAGFPHAFVRPLQPQPVLGHPLQESEGATSPRANCGNPCRKN